MDLLTWLVVGLIAGVLASLVVGGSGYGLVGDVVIGMVGALLGGWLFDAMEVASPIGGIAGSILVAFIGAVLLLVILHAVRRGIYRRRAPVSRTYVGRRRWWPLRRRF